MSITVGEKDWPVTPEMVDNVDSYARLVREYAQGGTLFVEKRLSFSKTIDVPDSYGTSDAVILKGDEIIVIDLKYGMGVRVDAEDNEQAQLYALGALEEYEFLGDFKMVTMVICQPRLNHVAEWVIPVEQLRAFGEDARLAAVEALWKENPPLNPGEKQCRFCRAKATCPALRDEVLGAVGGAATIADFEDVNEGVVRVGSGSDATDLAKALDKVGLVEDWCKAIRAEAERRILAGDTVPGYKLVEGRLGNRKWASEEAVKKAFQRYRMRKDEMYEFSLISPTKAEKVLTPARWEQLQTLISRAAGKASVALATDKRPAYTPSATAADFGD
jgi:hypothetical protein